MSALVESMRRISGLLQSGQYGAAHAQLESLVSANPEYVEGLRLFAGTKQALGDLVQAESLLRRALEIDPKWTPTLATLAELLLISGRTVEAVPLLQRAVQGSPAYPRAVLLLVRHYLDAGQPALALETAAPWCNSGKLDDDLSALHVAAYAALGRQSDAVATLSSSRGTRAGQPRRNPYPGGRLECGQPAGGRRARRCVRRCPAPDRRRRCTTRMLAVSSLWRRFDQAETGPARMREIGAAPRRRARQPGATRVDAHRRYRRGDARSGSGTRKIRA